MIELNSAEIELVSGGEVGATRMGDEDSYNGPGALQNFIECMCGHGWDAWSHIFVCLY